ncbi:unnamed protein product [Brassicogethes aeneus]|uniref:Dihydrolipoyllysine-residue succinyltransferase component of 2-oxoglutarate dehydrogenase complex, mitochondrial n=1 Tax=Brassicogethes aeneus TaxID=1431903 RepID=A0A9P0FMT7_BRAAE|nr:unnamed protein product [Brassicogethes aeneus]
MSMLINVFNSFKFRVKRASYKNICLVIRNIRTSSILNEIKTVVVPAMAESVTEGDARIQKKVGDHVAMDEVVVEIETDKTSVTVPAPGHGIITEILVKDGDTVKPNQAIFKIDITGVSPAGKPAGKPVAPPPTKPLVSADPLSAGSTPAAPVPSSKPVIMATSPPLPLKISIGSRMESRIKMNRMRQKIANRLKEAQNTCAMLTTFNEIDMSSIIKFRKENLEAFQKKYKIKLGFMSAFMKASAYALQEIPVVNATIDGLEIVNRDFVDISVAVATHKGLVVPVIKSVEKMNFAEIETSLANMSDKAKKGLLAVEDMDGGTFTVSNGGVFGSLMGTPIINPPQSAILGMHGTFERPIAIKGKVEVRPMMYVALTYDHRLIDGREAVMFLRKIKDGVENPTIILAGL